MLESDSDWVPSLHMDHREGNRRRRKKQRWTPKTRPSQSPSLISKELFRDQWSTRPSRESEAAGEGETDVSLQQEQTNNSPCVALNRLAVITKRLKTVTGCDSYRSCHNFLSLAIK